MQCWRSGSGSLVLLVLGFVGSIVVSVATTVSSEVVAHAHLRAKAGPSTAAAAAAAASLLDKAVQPSKLRRAVFEMNVMNETEPPVDDNCTCTPSPTQGNETEPPMETTPKPILQSDETMPPKLEPFETFPPMDTGGYETMAPDTTETSAPNATETMAPDTMENTMSPATMENTMPPNSTETNVPMEETPPPNIPETMLPTDSMETMPPTDAMETMPPTDAMKTDVPMDDTMSPTNNATTATLPPIKGGRPTAAPLPTMLNSTNEAIASSSSNKTNLSLLSLLVLIPMVGGALVAWYYTQQAASTKPTNGTVTESASSHFKKRPDPDGLAPMPGVRDHQYSASDGGGGDDRRPTAAAAPNTATTTTTTAQNDNDFVDKDEESSHNDPDTAMPLVAAAAAAASATLDSEDHGPDYKDQCRMDPDGLRAGDSPHGVVAAPAVVLAKAVWIKTQDNEEHA
jgi:hypothetical protein